MRKIILASQSPQRKLLMQALGIDFEVVPADIDEKAIKATSQLERAKKIAQAKAKEVAKNNSEAIVIAADTFTLFSGKAYEKPESKSEAIQMLEEQSGKSGVCYSGFSYVDSKNNIEFNKTAVTEFSFRKLSESEIQKYVDENPVMTWSAAFCPAYPAGINLVKDLSGSFSGFTHGLPMEMLMPLLESSGIFDEKKN